MITSREIILGFAAPAIVIAMAALLAGKAGRAWIAAVGMAAALGIGFVGMEDFPRFPPHSVEGWLFYLLGAAGAVGVIYAVTRASLWVRAITGMVLFASTMWLILRPLGHAMGGGEMVMWGGIFAVGMTGWWLAMDRLCEERPRGLWPALMAVSAGVGALVLMNTGQMEFGKLCGTISVVLFVVMVIDGWTGRSSLARSGSIVLTLMFWGLMVIGHFYGDVTWMELGLVLGAPVTAWAGQLIPARRRFWRIAVSTAPVLILLAIPAAPAGISMRHTILEQTGQL